MAQDSPFRPDLRSTVYSGSNFVSSNDAFIPDLFTGAATYSYTINVPQGTTNVQPIVSIRYNSHSANGRPSIVGAGWSISNNYIQRNANNSFLDSTDDEFILQLNDASYNVLPINDSYHTEIESYFNIKKKENGNNTNGDYWEVRGRDGTSYRFGFNNNSEMVSTHHNYTWRWSLDLVNDTHGNKIFYDYYENLSVNDSSAVYPKSIVYNNDKKRTVEFIYEPIDREDKWQGYYDGTKLQESRRLKEITTSINGNLIDRYKITYIKLAESLSAIQNITRFGSDNFTSMSPVSFEYYKENPGWTRETRWDPPQDGTSDDVSFMDYFESSGTVLMDVNRDGFADIIKSQFDTNYIKKSWINNGTGWEKTSQWHTPEDPDGTLYFAHQNKDMGTRIGDLNNDGLLDFLYARYFTSHASFAFVNNGSGWTRDSLYDLPNVGGKDLIFAWGHRDWGARLTDIDRNGKLDMVHAKYLDLQPHGPKLHQYTYQFNGTGWEQNLDWELPELSATELSFVFDYKDNGVRLADVNGDGLPDVIHASYDGTHKRSSWINNGSGWERDSNWNVPSISTIELSFVTDYKDKGLRLADVNGDGLVDLIRAFTNPKFQSTYINTGSGWEIDHAWKVPDEEAENVVFSFAGMDRGTRLGDVNGDGMIDLVSAFTYEGRQRRTWTNNAKKTRLLKKITNSFGGVTEIDYFPSTSVDKIDINSSGNMSFNLWVVRNITYLNGMNGPQNFTTSEVFDYSKPVYHTADRDFRGFNYVNKTQGNTFSEHWFHQDKARKGREYQTKLFDIDRGLLTETENSWISTDMGSYYVVELKDSSEHTFDGFSEAKIKNTSFHYDEYGNIISTVYDGDIGVSTDNRYEYYKYGININDWIISKPKIYQLFGSDNSTKLKETKFYYDNQLFGNAPVKGDITKKEGFVSTSDNPVSRFEYDSYGNLIKLFDANNNTVEFVFGIRDSTFTYPDKQINSLNHETNFYYDDRGNIISRIDSNSVNTSFEYDSFGRKTKEVLPYDSITVPTLEVEYDFDGIPPGKITIKKNDDTSTPYAIYNFYDGFGRIIQSKSEGNEGKQIEINTYYDKNGRVKFTTNPHFVNFDDNYSFPNISLGINYSYDAGNRITKVVNPDDTIKVITFSVWNVTVIDENSNKKQYLIDSSNKIISVYEFNGGEIYETSYDYDGSSNLIKITDSQGHSINFTFDELGRKTKLEDPDLGIWHYEYDGVGNLIVQTDGIGNKISLSYDALNRITKKNSTENTIIYVYDSDKNGTLSSVNTDSGLREFEYDDRYRIVAQKDSRFGMLLNTSFEYDSFDRITEKINPAGTIISYSYGNNSRLKSINEIITDISYNEIGLPSTRLYANNLQTNFEYTNDDLRLKRINTGLIQDLNYNYDSVGNVLSINDTSNNRLYQMAYDDLDRLKRADRADDFSSVYAFNYTYNSIGNIIQVESDGEVEDYYYNTPVHAPHQIK